VAKASWRSPGTTCSLEITGQVLTRRPRGAGATERGCVWDFRLIELLDTAGCRGLQTDSNVAPRSVLLPGARPVGRSKVP